MEFKPFTVHIAQSALDDLNSRLARTRWPNELPDVGWGYGVPVTYVKRLTDYWCNGYEWRNWEAKLNAYPQFTTDIDGQPIHFLHVRSPEPNALPVILTHGWPGSVFEWLDVIGPLTDPTAHGGDPADAYHLVIPSVPGFGFSGPTHDTGWNVERIARAWVTLMHGLGYERYAAVGNDWGSEIAPQMARLDGDHVVGVHVTQIFAAPKTEAEIAQLPPEDRRALEDMRWFNEHMSAYNHFQSQQPQTVAFALNDSPVGFLAWTCQIYREAADISDDFILTQASVYWLTDTIASSMRLYYESAHSSPPTEPTTFPMGLAEFRNDSKAFRSLAKHAHTKLIHWTGYDLGGHYAAHQTPDLWVNDVRTFFRALRQVS